MIEYSQATIWINTIAIVINLVAILVGFFYVQMQIRAMRDIEYEKRNVAINALFMELEDNKEILQDYIDHWWHGGNGHLTSINGSGPTYELQTPHIVNYEQFLPLACYDNLSISEKITMVYMQCDACRALINQVLNFISANQLNKKASPGALDDFEKEIVKHNHQLFETAKETIPLINEITSELMKLENKRKNAKLQILPKPIDNVSCGKQENEMETTEKHEWARHYDILFWMVATIMSTAIGGLLLFLASVKFSLALALMVINLIILTTYFAASFRELRFIFQDYRNDSIEKPIKNREFLQWWPYLFIFVFLCFYWIWLMCTNLPKGMVYWLLIGVINLVFIISLGFKANGSILEKRVENHQENKKLPELLRHIWAIDIFGIMLLELFATLCFIYEWIKF